MMRLNRSRMMRLLLAGVVVAATPLQGAYALSAPQVNTRDPYGGDIGGAIDFQNTLTSNLIGQANMGNLDFNKIATMGVGALIGQAISSVLKIDNPLVSAALGGAITGGLNQIASGQGMGNFGGMMSTALSSVILQQMGGIQGAASGSGQNFGATMLASAATSALTQQASGTGSTSSPLTDLAAAVVVGGIQGASANTASLTP